MEDWFLVIPILCGVFFLAGLFARRQQVAWLERENARYKADNALLTDRLDFFSRSNAQLLADCRPYKDAEYCPECGADWSGGTVRVCPLCNNDRMRQ